MTLFIEKVENFLGFTSTPEEAVQKIAADAQRDGIFVNLTDFGYDPRTRCFTSTQIAQDALAKLIEDGKDSHLLNKNDLTFLQGKLQIMRAGS